MSRSLVGEISVSTIVEDLDKHSKWLVTVVYGPNSSIIRVDFWKELVVARGRWNEPWCISGGWNIIRYLSDWVAPALIRIFEHFCLDYLAFFGRFADVWSFIYVI